MAVYRKRLHTIACHTKPWGDRAASGLPATARAWVHTCVLEMESAGASSCENSRERYMYAIELVIEREISDDQRSEQICFTRVHVHVQHVHVRMCMCMCMCLCMCNMCMCIIILYCIKHDRVVLRFVLSYNRLLNSHSSRVRRLEAVVQRL